MNTSKKGRIRGIAAVAVTAALLAGGVIAAAPASASQNPPTLGYNSVLHPGTYLQSHGTQYRLAMQTDGNLVETFNGRALWSTRTGGHPNAYLRMQTDGNAVVYTTTGKAVWSTQTNKHPNYGTNEIGIASDGNVYVKSNAFGVEWQNNAPGTNVLAGSNADLEAGWYLHASQAKLTMQSDGNLVSYLAGKAVWSSGTAGRGVSARLSSNGALQVVSGANGGGSVVWTSPAAGAGAKLQVGTDGRLTLLSGSKVVWKS